MVKSRLLKHLMSALLAVTAGIGSAMAQVDVNKADQAALAGVNGLGPAMSARILEARKQGGGFKDWNDLQKRVAGIGPKSVERLSRSGLIIGGKNPVRAAAQPLAAKPIVKATH